jgi:hypothetical protein
MNDFLKGVSNATATDCEFSESRAIEHLTHCQPGSASALPGGGLKWLVGIGAQAIPGLGPFIAAALSRQPSPVPAVSSEGSRALLSVWAYLNMKQALPGAR